MLQALLRPFPTTWYPQPGNTVALLVNNLGGLSLLELNAILDEVIRQVADAGLQIQYTLADSLLSSLDGPGFSITLFKLDEEIEGFLQASTDAPSWPRNVHPHACSTAANRCLQQESSTGKSVEEFTRGIQGKLRRKTTLAAILRNN
jgi:dihydroxyacetone kinase